MNLIDNAIKFSKQNGKITIDVKEENDEVVVKIKDNGMGMREEEVENILKDNNKTPKHGSGVGVINVHSRIKLMFGNKKYYRFIWWKN